MKLRKLMIPMLVIGILLASCSKDSGTEPQSGLDQNLVGNWTLQTYTDEDGQQDYTGFVNIEANGIMNGEFVDTEENTTATFSGNATSSGSTLTTEITQSNALWIGVGTYNWDYQINDQTLVMEGTVDDEFIVLNYTQGTPNPDEKGNLQGVVTAGRNPLEGVLVQVLGTNFSDQTNTEGEYLISEIPAGLYSVKFSKSGYEDHTENNVQISHEQTTTVNTLINQTSGGTGSVSGFAADVINQTVVIGANIEIEETSFNTATNSEGIYYLENVPAGNYVINCTKEGFDDTFLNIEIIADDDVSADFLLLPEGSTNSGSVAGFVTNPNGEPIVNVVCQVEGLYNSSLSFDNGSYEIFLIPAGTYNISFTKPGYETLVIENVAVTNGGTTNLDVQLQQIGGTGTLICYVENTFQIPINGAAIEILDTSFTGTTSALGTFTFQSVPTGNYTVRVSKTGYTIQDIENVEILSGLPQYIYVTLTN